MKVKRVLSMIVFLAALLIFLPTGARAEETVSGSSGNTHWTLDDQGTLIISGNGEMQGSHQWRDQSESIKSVVILEGITSIESGAFLDCIELESVSIPQSVIRIESYAFKDCRRLANIEFSDGLIEIGNFTFSGCISLREITIPDSVTDIDEYGFSSCTSLKTVTIGSGIEFIMSSAFSGCTGLTDIYFVGDAPVMENIFYRVTAAAHYPAYNDTWTEDVRQDYDGNITWEPYYYTGSRIYGDNRWATSLKIAEEIKVDLDVDKFDSIIIASGNDFADALAGSYLAAVKHAPILLSWGKGGKFEYLDEDNIAYIKANLAANGTVYILGGTNAVPELYENELAGWNVKRLGGGNRFDTNLLILQEAGVPEGEEILVCTATNFADSLSASATGKPILLVWNEGGKLFDSQAEYLAGLANSEFCIIGGGNAVDKGLEAAISAYGRTNRLAGKDRFATSVLVAERYFQSPESVVLAYAWNYPDGLCGGALAYSVSCPLILIMNCYEAAAADFVADRDIHHCIILGGSGLIGDDAVDAVFGGSTPGHAYSHSVVEPTISARGYTIHICAKCGHSYKDTYTDKLPDDSWKDAFLEHITEGTEDIPTDIATYYLLHIDEDQIPELWIDYGYTFAGCNLAVYTDGGINSSYFSAGGLYYQSFDNIFVHRYGRQGWYGDNVYSLNNGTCELLASGTYQSQMDENGYPNYEAFDYYWEEEPVSEARYNREIAEYIDLETCETPYYNALSFTYEEILEYLAN